MGTGSRSAVRAGSATSASGGRVGWLRPEVGDYVVAHAADPGSHPGGGDRRRARRPAPARLLPCRRRAGRRAGDVRRARVRREGPAQEPARAGRRRARAGARRGRHRRHGQLDQLQHGVDLDLRAAADVRVPQAPRQGERVGRPPRPAVPRRRLRRLGRGAARRLGRAQLEAGRQGRRALQPRRRPGPVRPRRLDAGGQPAHLGLRDQLRRPGRPVGRQGQPAHAQAGPPHVGGGRRSTRCATPPATACSSASTRPT